MEIELVLSPKLYSGRALQNHSTAVVVDVLRATSAICAAFASGASRIVPLDDIRSFSSWLESGYAVAAERGGKKLPGATYGNSPTEYLSSNLNGMPLAYSTTNGTVAIRLASESPRLYVGAFANLSALAETIAKQSSEGGVVVLCSGWKSDPSIEDTLFAGALTEKLISLTNDISIVNDSLSMALDLWTIARADLYGYCSKATHFHRLMNLGCEADIRWSLTLDSCSLAPRYDTKLNALVCE